MNLNFGTITALLMTAGLIGAPLGSTHHSDVVACDELPDEADLTVPLQDHGADEVFWRLTNYYFDIETESVYRESNGYDGLQTTSGSCDSNGDGTNDLVYGEDGTEPRL